MNLNLIFDTLQVELNHTRLIKLSNLFNSFGCLIRFVKLSRFWKSCAYFNFFIILAILKKLHSNF